MIYTWILPILMLIGLDACQPEVLQDSTTRPGAYQIEEYLPMIDGKSLGLVVNQTSMVDDTHLLDTLLSLEANVKAVFAPEHGFRGEASAGAKISDNVDPQTGIPIISIYGKSKKPSADQLEDIDVVIFDIQDVGVRFYTYISTLEYVMEACAENDIPVIILDRPNPNGHYVDGPILDTAYRSFVGRQPIPIVHGLTVGEYGRMLNGERWLRNGIQCDLTVIKCENWDHQKEYILPIPPSPNLPNQRAIYLYPSLCLFEGTTVSVGRGTEKQFQVILHPNLPDTRFSETPIKRPGAKWPKHENKLCYGYDLTDVGTTDIRNEGKINLGYILETYVSMGKPDDFFLESNFIDKLYGSSLLRKLMLKNYEDGADFENIDGIIRKGWSKQLMEYKKKREKYLLYP